MITRLIYVLVILNDPSRAGRLRNAVEDYVQELIAPKIERMGENENPKQILEEVPRKSRTGKVITVAEIEANFVQIDSQRTGRVSPSDYAVFLYKYLSPNHTITDRILIARSIQTVFEQADFNDDNVISKNEFIHYWLVWQREHDPATRSVVHQFVKANAGIWPGFVHNLVIWFKEKDLTGRGKITKQECLELLRLHSPVFLGVDGVNKYMQVAQYVSSAEFPSNYITYAQYVSLMFGQTGSSVYLAKYDITPIIARKRFSWLFAPNIANPTIWHTSIIAFGLEWFYGNGIDATAIFSTVYGKPTEIIYLGETARSYLQFQRFVFGGDFENRYTYKLYNLLDHNCNHFSNEVSQYLVNKEIPREILDMGKNLPKAWVRLFLEWLLKSKVPAPIPSFTPVIGEVLKWSKDHLKDALYGQVIELAPNDQVRIRYFDTAGFKMKLVNRNELSLPQALDSTSLSYNFALVTLNYIARTP